MAVTECPEKGVQSPTPIGGLDFLDMDRLLKNLGIRVLDFLDTLNSKKVTQAGSRGPACNSIDAIF